MCFMFPQDSPQEIDQEGKNDLPPPRSWQDNPQMCMGGKKGAITMTKTPCQKKLAVRMDMVLCIVAPE